MFTMQKRIFFLTIAFAFFKSALSVESKVPAWGVGNKSCASYLQSDSKIVYDVWIAGYLTGRSYGASWESTTPIFSKLDSGVYSYYLNSYCVKHPSHAFVNAADVMFDSIVKEYIDDNVINEDSEIRRNQFSDLIPKQADGEMTAKKVKHGCTDAEFKELGDFCNLPDAKPSNAR